MLVALPVAAVAACAAYLAYSFEFFLRKRIPEPLEVRAALPLVAASDLHLGHEGAGGTDLIGRFAEDAGARAIVVAGDVFEKRRPLKGVEDAERLFEALGRPRVEKLLVTLSSHSHDVALEGDFSTSIGGVEALLTNRPLLISAPPLKVLALHGDLFCKNGFLASLCDRVFGRFALERAARRALSLGDEWLLVGHTHLPGVDGELRIANPGCWKGYWRSPATMTVVLFTERGAELASLTGLVRRRSTARSRRS